MEWIALGAALLFLLSQSDSAVADSGGGISADSSGDLLAGVDFGGAVDQLSADVQSGFDAIGAAVSQTQSIATYASTAGFSGGDLLIAVAIALAESGGNPQAYNPEVAAGTPQGQGSYGLWQIYLKAHPEFRGWDLYDPQTNANAAFSVYRAAGNSFRPWATFSSKAYTARLSAAAGLISQSVGGVLG